MWLKILRQNISHLARRAKGTSSIEQKNSNAKPKTNNNGAEVNRNEENNSIDFKSQKKKTGGLGNGPLLQQTEVSSSQLDFFRMLDEKIENGPDYDESLDAAHRAERISDLVRRWELAMMTWSSVTDLDSTPGILATAKALECPRQMSAKDREGMRNIIGGRPECAPVFIRNANRVDGLEEIQNPSPVMPRHVLESISQSPTQSVKNSTPPGTSPTSFQFQDYNNKDYNSDINTLNHHQIVTNSYQNSQSLGNQNEDFVAQRELYRDQYLQQAGIITVQPQYPSPNVLRNSNYVQQFQLPPISPTQQHFPGRKRSINTAQMT